MKKMPWGIIAGAFAMLWSFITVALVALLIVSASMKVEVGTDDGISSSWYMVALYVGEAISIICFAVSTFLYVWKKKYLKKRAKR